MTTWHQSLSNAAREKRPKLSIALADLIIVLLMCAASPCDSAQRLICEILQPFQSEMVHQACMNCSPFLMTMSLTLL